MRAFSAKIPAISVIFGLFCAGCGDDGGSADDDGGSANGGTTATGGASGSASGSGGTMSVATPPGELFRDDFENGITKWDVTQGTCSIAADETNVLTCINEGNEARAVAGDIWGEFTVSARVRINELDAAGGRRIYLAARFTDSNNWYGVAIYDGNPFEVQIRKKVAGTSSDIARTPYPFVVGQWHTLKLEVKGSTLKAYADDVLQLTAEDTQFASGRIAILVDRTNASWDDVLATNP
jgi:hypothetical protein